MKKVRNYKKRSERETRVEIERMVFSFPDLVKSVETGKEQRGEGRMRKRVEGQDDEKNAVEGERGELCVTNFCICMCVYMYICISVVRLSMMIVTREILHSRFPSHLAVANKEIRNMYIVCRKANLWIRVSAAETLSTAIFVFGSADRSRSVRVSLSLPRSEQVSQFSYISTAASPDRPGRRSSDHTIDSTDHTRQVFALAE